MWRGGFFNEREKLVSCYKNSLLLAKQYDCNTVAFPLISSGAFGYPKDKALKTATETISEFLLENEMLVYIVVFDKKAFTISKKLFCDIKQYIDDNYVDAYVGQMNFRLSAPMCAMEKSLTPLEERLEQIDESFSQMLLRKIEEKGLKDSECYKKANIDRKLFSKIKSNVNYKPSKTTAIAFAISLELDLRETKDMLMKAGYALSRSNKFDIIIEYFISNKNYNIFEINEALFAFDQSLLGV